MAPSSSPELDPERGSELDPELDSVAASELVEVARRSIRAGFDGRGRYHPDLQALSPVLREPRGAFVTVLVDGDLNGCMGAIEPTRPLAEVVADEARSAAFEDPRLPPLREEQLARVDLEVSVLSDLEPMAVTSLDELLDALRPGVDGLVIEAGSRRGLFLPQVWEQLPEPAHFVAHLQAKAGIAVGSWPLRMHCHRFTVTHVGEPWDPTRRPPHQPRARNRKRSPGRS